MVPDLIDQFSWDYILGDKERHNSPNERSLFISKEDQAIHKAIIHFLSDLAFDILRELVEDLELNEPSDLPLRRELDGFL